MLEGDSEVGVQLVGTIKVEVPQARLADGAHDVDIIGGVTTLGVEVEVRADGAGRQAQGATLLEAIHILSVDVVEVFNVCSGTCTLSLFSTCATVTAGAEQADGTQGRGTANERTAAEAILSRFVAGRGVCGVRGHGSSFWDAPVIPASVDYLCIALHNFV